MPPVAIEQIEKGQGLNLEVKASQYRQLADISGSIEISLPITMNQNLSLELERFNVIAPDARFYIGSPSGDIEISPPEVITMRGTVSGESNSHAYLSLTKSGCANGYITTESGETYFVSQKPGDLYAVVNPGTGLGELPPWVEFCIYPTKSMHTAMQPLVLLAGSYFAQRGSVGMGSLHVPVHT